MSGFVEAQWTIPHCQFQETPDGFKVEYNTASKVGYNKMAVTPLLGIVLGVVALGLSIYIGTAADSFIVGIVVFGVTFFVGIKLIVSLVVGKKKTTIEVTKDAVIVDNKRLRRADFSHFVVNSTTTLQAKMAQARMAVLGYTYGTQTFEFGGMWEEQKATEFASALNKQMRVTPMAGAENIASPELLRTARPTDF